MAENISDIQMEQDLADAALVSLADSEGRSDFTAQEEIAQAHTMDAGLRRVPIYVGMIRVLRSRVAALKDKLARQEVAFIQAKVKRGEM